MRPLPALLEGLEVAVGKYNIQVLHPRPVFKQTFFNAILYLNRHPPIKGGEITEAAALLR